jgi:hypothetical protein
VPLRETLRFLRTVAKQCAALRGSGRFHMEKDTDRKHAATVRQVLNCGPFASTPMAKWKPLAAAVSQTRFDEHVVAFVAYVDRELRGTGCSPGTTTSSRADLRTSALGSLAGKVRIRRSSAGGSFFNGDLQRTSQSTRPFGRQVVHHAPQSAVVDLR